MQFWQNLGDCIQKPKLLSDVLWNLSFKTCVWVCHFKAINMRWRYCDSVFKEWILFGDFLGWGDHGYFKTRKIWLSMGVCWRFLRFQISSRSFPDLGFADFFQNFEVLAGQPNYFQIAPKSISRFSWHPYVLIPTYKDPNSGSSVTDGVITSYLSSLSMLLHNIPT